jgi:hypothetical protein
MRKKMKKFADGGFSAAQEEFLGGADRTDPYILARMRAAVPDEKIKESVVEETSEDLDPYGAAGKKPSAVERTVVKTKVTPSSKSTSFASKDEEGNKLPTDVKKPHIAIPKNAAGMQQYRSDAVSPVERLFKSMMESKSQRSKAAGLNSGGKVKSASARADGCAIRGKTRA